MVIILRETGDIAILLGDKTGGINSTVVNLPQEEGGERISAARGETGNARLGGFRGGETNDARDPRISHPIIVIPLVGPAKLQGMTPTRPGEIVIEADNRSEEHTSELQSRQYLVCRLLLEK